MITVIQRVTTAQVNINGLCTGKINRGILALVAVQKQDNQKHADRLLERILNYRIFPDDKQRMNLNLQDIDGGLLLVPQFTLAADTQTGNRPSFTPAAPPEQGQLLFEYLLTQARSTQRDIAAGQFGADMQVALVNDGPVTFTLTVK
jgi:D-aminoacyl-tRNA deacylase